MIRQPQSWTVLCSPVTRRGKRRICSPRSNLRPSPVRILETARLSRNRMNCSPLRNPTDCNDFQMWEFMEKEVKKRLPFRNVQWRSTTGRQRVIDVLDVEIKPFSTALLQDENLVELYHKPLLHLYIVSCDVCPPELRRRGSYCRLNIYIFFLVRTGSRHIQTVCQRVCTKILRQLPGWSRLPHCLRNDARCE